VTRGAPATAVIVTLVAGACVIAGSTAAHAATTAPAPREVTYLGNSLGSVVEVIDTLSHTVVKTISGFNGPGSIAVTPDGTTAYVANRTGTTVSLIDTATNTISGTVAGFSQPKSLAIAPDGKHVYVSDYAAGTIDVIDTATNTVSATVAVGTHPDGVVVAPDGGRVYAAVTTADFVIGAVAVIDTTSNTVTASITVGTTPTRLAVTPDGAKVYVTNYYSDNVSVIATATDSVSATVATGDRPSSVAVSPDGTQAYIANSFDGTVSILSTATDSVTGAITGFTGPSDVAFTPDGTLATVVDYPEVRAWTIDVATQTRTASVMVSSDSGIAYAKSTPVPPTVAIQLTATDVGVHVTTTGTSAGWYPLASVTYDFGDGTPPAVLSPNNTDLYHSYAHGGTYPVTFTATDTVGESASVSATFTARVLVRQVGLMASNDRYVTAENGGAQPLIANRAGIGPWETFDVFDMDGTHVALRSHANNKFVTVGSTLVAAAGDISGAALFTPTSNSDGTESLLSVSNSRYVSGNDGTSALTADRTSAGPWELFREVLPPHVSNYLKSLANGRYVTTPGSAGPLIASDAAGITNSETYDMVGAGDGYIALFAHADSEFVSADNGGNSPLIANRTVIGQWERFKVIDNGDHTFSLQALANGRYVTAENGGDSPLIANRTAIGQWEKFDGSTLGI
jgi:YVTN family beta-propeller protein